MSKNVTLYNLLISCPGDINDEIGIIKESVEEFNELYSDKLGIRIETKHWHKSSYAQSGGKPQELLNKQFVNDCDAAVAIFWTRFGLPTDKYGSGTEEEINLMLDSGKQIFMYFSEKPISPGKCDHEGYQKIREFQSKYKEKGIYYTYTTDDDFRKTFFAHLSQHFLTQKIISEYNSSRRSILSLCGIDENSKICNNLVICQFELNLGCTVTEKLNIIEDTINKINNINIPTYLKQDISSDKNNSLENSIVHFMIKPVKFEDEVIKSIKNVADSLKISLSENFFDIGNLQCSTIPMGGGLNGTEAEINKYNLIKQLYSMINDIFNLIPIESFFNETPLPCFKLVLINNGTDIDNDVEISIAIPKKALLIPEDFPTPDEDTIDYLISNYDFKELFEISETYEYKRYPFKEEEEKYEMNIPDIFLSSQTDYSQDYIDLIKQVFCYSILSNDDMYILRLTFDYIKHNTAIAFPMPIFLKENISKIEYTITSTNALAPIKGTLNIVDSK